MTVAQTFDIVHGLANCNGTYVSLAQISTFMVLTTNLVDGKASTDDIRRILGGSGLRA